MAKIRFGEGLNVIPILSPQDIAGTATATAYVDLDMANWVTLMINFGNMTSDDSDTMSLTVECSTAGSSNATEEAIGFTYRLSSAINTNSWGAATAATSDGVTGTSDNGWNAANLDGKSVLVDIDPAAVAAKMADARWIRAVITPGGTVAALVSAYAFVEPRYQGATIPSSS